MSRSLAYPSTDEARTARLRIPVSPTERADIAAQAATAQRSIAEYIRMRLLGHLPDPQVEDDGA